MTFESNETDAHQVVRNDTGQYALWPGDVDVPAGWHATGACGSKESCLAYVREHWRDMFAGRLQRRTDTVA